jgi:hypothetical protein
LGTWSCTTGLNAIVVKAFGLSTDGKSLILSNAYVSSNRILGAMLQCYTDNGSVLTVSERQFARTFTGTSHGWSGDALVFVGPVVVSPAPVPAGFAPAPLPRPLLQRETYTRVDADHFKRSLETRPLESGPWSAVSLESCQRIVAPLAETSPSP